MTKSIFFLLLIFMASNLLLGQNETSRDRFLKSKLIEEESLQLQNELKLNVAGVPFGYFEVTYERVLPGNTSIGMAYGKSLEEDIDLNFHVFAFYRLFFGQKEAKGFFIEGNGAYWKDGFFNEASNGLGVAVGGKFFRGSGLIGEVVFGIGRTLNDNSTSGFSDSYPRFGILLGRRF